MKYPRTSLIRFGTPVRSMVLLAICSVLFLQGGAASAVTPAQQRAWLNGVNYFNTEVGTASCAASSSSSVPETSNTSDGYNIHDPSVLPTYQYFTTNGYTPAQAAGIVGNFMVESYSKGIVLNPLATDGTAFGIAQWQGGRLTSMRAWVSAQPAPNNSPNTRSGQLPFVLQELKTTHTLADAQLKKTTTPDAAAKAWGTYFEVFDVNTGSGPLRVKKAVEIFNAYSGTTASTGGCAGNGNDASPNCTTATGTTKILCEAKKYNGIYYTFGGGHAGYDNFRKACPLSAIPSAASSSTASNQGPCSTDCSSLVSIAVDEAFGQKYMWTVSEDAGATMLGTGAEFWKPVASVSAAQPGDIVTRPGHVEIVDHIGSNTLYSFGSHHTGTKTGQVTVSIDYYTHAYHWTGPGGN